jgi:hypothetical protein
MYVMLTWQHHLAGLTFDSGGYNIKAGAGSMIGAPRCNCVCVHTKQLLTTPSRTCCVFRRDDEVRYGASAFDELICSLPHLMTLLLFLTQGGAGAVLGAARALGGLAPTGVTCHFVVASCENMIGSRGLRPGDILTASNGKTIEVNNTDAGA